MKTPLTRPDLSLEHAAQWAGAREIAGLDEAGRGPLAGPVVAAAVILDPRFIPEGLNDSKLLSKARRASLADDIRASARAWAVAEASVDEVDQINILQASHLAMRRATRALGVTPDHLLIDGNRRPGDLPCAAATFVRGDARSASIAAASILAKEARDLIMVDLAQLYPGYGWEHNAGYPTKMHLSALQDLGPTPVHRRSFAPVRNILWQEETTSR